MAEQGWDCLVSWVPESNADLLLQDQRGFRLAGVSV